MEPSTIIALTTAAFNLIKPFLKTFSEGAVKKAGEEAGKSVYEAVKAKLTGSAAGQEIVEEAEKNPEDETALQMLELQLKKVIQADAEFATHLKGLVEQASAEYRGTTIQNTVHGDVGQQNVVGTNYGGISYSPPSEDSK